MNKAAQALGKLGRKALAKKYPKGHPHWKKIGKLGGRPSHKKSK